MQTAPQPARLVNAIAAAAMGGGRAQRRGPPGGVEGSGLLWIDPQCLAASDQMEEGELERAARWALGVYEQCEASGSIPWPSLPR